MNRRVFTAVILGYVVLAGCVSGPREAPVAVASDVAGATPAPDQASSAAAFLTYGKHLFTNTKSLMPANVGAAMSCKACHLDAGTRPHGLSLRGAYTTFPRWNARAGRFIEVEDRIAECFLYSLNGRAPPYASRQMIAIASYIASLSKGVPLGSSVPEQGLIPVHAPAKGDAAHGAGVFSQRCAVCHGADGAGTAAAPPLWGPRSFNTGAGMHRQDTLAAFVRYNMPFGSPPNTLSAQEAVDVAAFILRHRRPLFHGRAPVIFQPEPAHFF
jgi:thiosulfate dehydrogenase